MAKPDISVVRLCHPWRVLRDYGGGKSRPIASSRLRGFLRYIFTVFIIPIIVLI